MGSVTVRHRDLKEQGSSGSSEQATDSPRSAARAFHILPVLLKNDLWKVLLQDLIKNKVISKLLVYLVVLVGAPIGGVTVGLFSTCPVTALKRNTTSRYSCQYVRGSRFNCTSYPYMIVDNEMEDWGCILKLDAESAPSCKPVQSIEGPTLVFCTQVGTSHVK